MQEPDKVRNFPHYGKVIQCWYTHASSRQRAEKAHSRLSFQSFDLIGVVCLFALTFPPCSVMYGGDPHIPGYPSPEASCGIWSIGIPEGRLAISEGGELWYLFHSLPVSGPSLAVTVLLLKFQFIEDSPYLPGPSLSDGPGFWTWNKHHYLCSFPPRAGKAFCCCRPLSCLTVSLIPEGRSEQHNATSTS